MHGCPVVIQVYIVGVVWRILSCKHASPLSHSKEISGHCFNQMPRRHVDSVISGVSIFIEKSQIQSFDVKFPNF